MFCENHFGLAGTVFGVLCFAPARAHQTKLSTSRDFKLLRPSPARQVLPAADQPGPDQHATRGADGEQEGVPEASQPGRGHHDLVWPEGGGVHTRLRLKTCLIRPQDCSMHCRCLRLLISTNQEMYEKVFACFLDCGCRNFIQRSNLERYHILAPPLPHISLRLVCVPPKRLE